MIVKILNTTIFKLMIVVIDKNRVIIFEYRNADYTIERIDTNFYTTPIFEGFTEGGSIFNLKYLTVQKRQQIE